MAYEMMVSDVQWLLNGNAYGARNDGVRCAMAIERKRLWRNAPKELSFNRLSPIGCHYLLPHSSSRQSAASG